MRSLQLEQALVDFIEQAGAFLRQEVQEGAEVPFELAESAGRGQRPALYSYRPLTGRFVQERSRQLRGLDGYAPAAELIATAPGLERYLLARGVAQRPVTLVKSAEVALIALLADVFCEQTDFQVRGERLRAALQALQSASGRPDEVTVIASLRGMTIGSDELALARGLQLAKPQALAELPPQLGLDATAEPQLFAVFASEQSDPRAAVGEGRAVLGELLRALRLFGDGRISIDEMAWARVGDGSWSPVTMSGGGRPRGMLLITPEQEDELRAFCSLVSRRVPSEGTIAWALERFQAGCEQASEYRALSDYLLALRALLEPEGAQSGMLAARVAALCAASQQRDALAGQVTRALELERAVIAGAAVPCAAGEDLVRALADHLRALLRDVICGHLDPELTLLADELLAGDPDAGQATAPFHALELAQALGVSDQAPAGEANPSQGELWPAEALPLAR